MKCLRFLEHNFFLKYCKLWDFSAGCVLQLLKSNFSSGFEGVFLSSALRPDMKWAVLVFLQKDHCSLSCQNWVRDAESQKKWLLELIFFNNCKIYSDVSYKFCWPAGCCGVRVCYLCRLSFCPWIALMVLQNKATVVRF